MRKLTPILLLIGLLCSSTVQGQDPHFTQFYSSPLYLNPAFAGANVCSRISATYRNQWAGVPNGYRTSLFSFDHYARRQAIGFGFQVTNDVAGTGSLRRTTLRPMLATEVQASRNLGLRFGIKPGIGFTSVDFQSLLFGDQIYRQGGISGSLPTIETPTQSVTYFDIGAGILMYGSQYWFGVSFDHFTQPMNGLTEFGGGRIPLKMSVHGGYRFNLEGGGDDRNATATSISPAFNYRGQGEFDQFDLGFYYTKGAFNLGFWYRGIPVLKSYAPGYPNDDSMALIIGFKTHRFNIGYSYDYTISELTNASNGAHEISISQQLCNPKRRKRKRVFLPCPSF